MVHCDDCGAHISYCRCRPCPVEAARAQLARRTQFERVIDELLGAKWSTTEAVVLKDMIDAGTQPNRLVSNGDGVTLHKGEGDGAPLLAGRVDRLGKDTR